MANPYADEIKWWRGRAAEFDAKRAALRPMSFEQVSGAYKQAGNKNGEWTFDSSKSSYDSEWQRLYDEQKRQGAQTEYLGWGFAHAKWPPPKGKGGTTREPTHPSVLKPSDKVLDLEHQNDTLMNKIGDVGGTFVRTAFKGLAAVGDILERTGFMVRSVVEENMNEYKGANTAGGTDITTGEFLKSIGKSFGTFTPQVAAVRALTGDKEQKEEFGAAWQGLSGKNKIFSDELLKEVYPEWTSNHKKWTTALGFGGDVLSNPLTYVTLGDGAVVQGVLKGAGAVGFKAVGQRALAENLLKTTVWTKSGRQAGTEALEDWARMRALKPEYKAVKQAAKANVKAGKQVKKAKPGAKPAAQAKATSSADKLRLAQEALVDASMNQADDAFKGLNLARKAIFNKTLGFGSYNAYSKGVRAGGLIKGAQAYENGLKALRVRYADDLFKGPQNLKFRKFHAVLAGQTVKLAGQMHEVPKDYDDFIDWFSNKIYPIVPIKQMTKAAAKRRYAIDNAAQAKGKQFYADYLRATREAIRQQGLEPPPGWGDDIPTTPTGPHGGGPTPPAGPHGGGPTPPGGGGGGPTPTRPPTPGSNGNAAPVPAGWGEHLPDFEPPPEPITVPTRGGSHTDVHVNTLDDDVEALVNATDARRLQDEKYWDNMSDAERVYAERMGYSPSLMSYKLFAQHLIDHTNPENIAIVNDFITDVRQGLQQAGVESKYTPILNEEGQISNLMPVIKDWKEYRQQGGSPDYDRARNAEIAQIVSQAWHTAQYKLAVTEMANDPVAVVNAMQGATAHIINQLTADTHIQVSQYLTSKYGLSFLPMAPNRAVINAGGLPGVIKRIQDIDPFLERGVKSNRSLSEPNVKGKDLRLSIQQKLQIDIRDAINKLAVNDIVPHPESGVQEIVSNLIEPAHDWLNRSPLIHTFKDTETGEMAASMAKFIKGQPIANIPIPGSTPHMYTLNDAVFTILAKGEQLINDLHFTKDDSISRYSVMDHWMYGDKVAEETKIITRDGKPSIGRLAHIEKVSNEDQAILANLKETLPQMDEDLLSAMRLVKSAIANHNADEIPFNLKMGLHDFMNEMLAPDWARLHTDMNGVFQRDLQVERAMETLGWHLDTLSSTVPGGTSVGVRAAMAREIWAIPILYKELNQSIMLGTLHHVIAARRNPEQAADAIASLVKKYPLVEDLLNGAHAAGTTNGTNGVRTHLGLSEMDPSAASPVPAPAGGPVTELPPLPEGAGPFTSNVEESQARIEKILAERRARNEPPEEEPPAGAVAPPEEPPPTPTPAPATVEAVPHTAAEHTPASDDVVPKTDPKPSAISSKANPKTQAEGDAAAKMGNPPGGFSTPTALRQDQLDEVNEFMSNLKQGINLAEISRVIDDAESSINAAMAEFHAAVKTEFENYRIKTGKVVRFMGMPVAPLPGLITPGQSYAGVIGLKEKQSRVSNWLDIWPKNSQSRMYAQLMLRRASKSLDSVVNDIRRSVSNNAQERLVATHQIIRETYIQFKNKAERMADTRLYFTSGTGLPPKFKEIDERMKMIGDSIRKEPDGKVRRPNIIEMYAKQFNNALPKKYRLPDEVFNGKMDSDLAKMGLASDQPHFSREWFIGVSKWLESQGTHQHHVLSATMLKNDLHMGNYEFALHHALMKLELSRDLHLSMFDNFTFRMDDKLVQTMNQKLKFEDQFVKLDTYYGAETNKYVNREYADRWVRRGMAEEMSKVSRFVEQQNVYRAGNINFGVMTKINNYWKSMVTNWNIPNYHIGNVMSDGFLNSMDGVKPDAYRKAAIVMSNSHPLSKRIKEDPEGYARLMRSDLPMDPGEYAREMKELGDPARARVVSMVMVNGKPTPLDSEMIFKLYHDYGLGQTQVNGNILRSGAIPHNKAQQFYTNTTDYVLDLSNGREDYFRIAHFISALESESKLARRSMEDIVVAARDRVIKYHFDYGDVSELERLAVARYMPFYKWQRNILPLAVGQLFTNPRVYTIGNAANRAMGEMLFPSQEDANGNVIPVDYITPNFVGDSNMVPIGKYTDTEGNEQARYAVLNLPLDQALVTWLMPFVSAVTDPNVTSLGDKVNTGVSNTVSTLMSKSNPFLVAMTQAGLGKTAVAGDSFPSKPYDWARTLGNVAAPGAGPALEAIETAQKGEPQKTWGGQLGFVRERKNTPGIQSGTLREEGDRMEAVYNKAAAKWMKSRYPGIDPKSDEGKKILKDYFISTGTLQK